MERIIKKKEYFIITAFIIILCIFSYLHVENYEKWWFTISPFNIKITRILGIYFVMVVVYTLINFEIIILHTRENFKYCEKYTMYGKWGMMLISLVFGLPHLLTLYLIISKNSNRSVFLLGCTALFVKLLFQRLYVGESYFIVSAKKYYYNNIEKVIDDESNKLKLLIDNEEHLLICGSKRVKQIILEKLKEEAIIIVEWQLP